ncbi:MAG TPA: type I-U CRISPR-associated protein Csb2 [Kofleriaceae bacterium]|nr:type I-U CRISPR-associated protein Csb2 [Kofleriaceae bacterium]
MYDETSVIPPGSWRTGWAHASQPDRSAESRITAVRFALSSRVLPSLADALTVGDRVRMALLRCSDSHPVFLGRDAAGQVARGPRHEHAWVLPADDDTDGVLDHVVVYARGGFDFAALRSLVRLRRVWGHSGPDLSLTLVDLGSPGELGCLRRDTSGARTAQLGTARVWESMTPFAPVRHTKLRAGRVRDAPDEQVARLLALHGRPPAQIALLAPEAAMQPRPPSIAWQRFQRRRMFGAGSRGGDAAFGFRLCFDRPVTGPIVLGYAAHQGLGQFVAVA